MKLESIRKGSQTKLIHRKKMIAKKKDEQISTLQEKMEMEIEIE